MNKTCVQGRGNEEEDINSVFSDLLSSEELLNRRAFDKGFTSGSFEGSSHGFHLGYHRGSEIGAELGYYQEIIKHYHSKLTNEKHSNAFHKLQTEIEAFPEYNEHDDDLLNFISNIRASFKKICSILKIDPTYPEADKFSF